MSRIFYENFFMPPITAKIGKFRQKRRGEGRKTMRIDKFLKVSRILKRRTVAGDACKAGKVSVNGKEVKPSYQLKAGDVVELAFAAGSLKFRVLQLKETVKKDEAPSLYEIVSSPAGQA